MASARRLPCGKVPWELVASKVCGALPPEVLRGPACGEDAALVRMGDELWAVASDPITFTARDAGRLVVLVNANDVAASGARPRFFTAVVLVGPEAAEPARIAGVLAEIRTTCARLGVTLIGGHTEVTPGLPRGILVGTMLGRVVDRPLATGGLREGDRIGITKFAGLEGTSILLGEFGERAARACSADALAAAARILHGDWLSIVPEAEIAWSEGAVTALHDVTEGGVGEALHEMAAASGRELSVRAEAIPVLEATRALGEALGMDPLGLIGSGALLVGCAPAGADRLEAAYRAAGIPFTWIGRAGAAQAVPSTGVARFARDEVLKAWLLDGIDAVLFDMDGTLVDSKYDWPAIREALEIQGHSILDELDAMPSPRREEKWALLERFEREASLKARLKDGAKELVAVVRARGLKTALVTNNSGGSVALILERYGLQFDALVTRDSGLYKPSGAPLVEALRQLGVAPERSLFVGDYLFDVVAARAAGCARVGILYDPEGRFSRDADFTFPDVNALRRHLEFVL
ncbi:MAG: HAD-IA family hydrolase [Planctomycetes bacterium]|nr:HAD-IA family hydrolase [Planctomycetota bacterium]